MKKFTTIATFCVLLLTTAGALALFQNNFGKGVISGNVADETGQHIAGATIAITDKNNNHTGKKTTTDANGNYSLKNLTAGKYHIQCSIAGYKSATQLPVELKTDSATAQLNFTIPPISTPVAAAPSVPKSESLKRSVQRIADAAAQTFGGYKSISTKTAETTYAPNTYINIMEPEEDQTQGTEHNTNEFNLITENEFLRVSEKPLSTLSIDVDVASYSLVRQSLNNGQFPPKDAVRIEEMLNYFTYNYPTAKGNVPFSVYTEMNNCPWNTQRKLLHIGISGKEIEKQHLPPSNLVFLIDVSGSMWGANRLGLVKQSLRMLVNELNERDHIALVVYAGASGLALPSTSCQYKDKIIDAIEQLEAGGSTAGAAGIQLAYKVAQENFLKNGNNRVILCTDGDFNVGISSQAELIRLIEEKRQSNIFLSVLGYGMGNYKDSKMEQLADKGNGNYAYIDNILEANKVLVTQMGATLHTIAKDVKIQVEFNPAFVKGYRLIGYENRLLADRDFNDDTKDAGEIGAGAGVTALYEIITDEKELASLPTTDKLKYQQTKEPQANNHSEWLNVKIRYKEPTGSTSKLIETPVTSGSTALANTSDNFKFSAAVASFGMLLRQSKHSGNFNFSHVLALAKEAKGKDEDGYRAEFIRLVQTAQSIGLTTKK